MYSSRKFSNVFPVFLSPKKVVAIYATTNLLSLII